MLCCMKRASKIERRYRKNMVAPSGTQHPLSKRRVDKSFMDEFLKELIYCGYCNALFNLKSNEIKIHCNICNEFFHCGIAGECRGKDCILINSNGTQHRASYCINCVTHMYEDKTCLCKDCSTK